MMISKRITSIAPTSISTLRYSKFGMTLFSSKQPGAKFENLQKDQVARVPNKHSSDGSAEEEEFTKQIKELRKTNSLKKMIKLVEDYSVGGNLTLNMTLFTLRSLQLCNRMDMGMSVYKFYEEKKFADITSNSIAKELQKQPSLTTALLKWYCKAGNISVAERIAGHLEIETSNHASITVSASLDELLRQESNKNLTESIIFQRIYHQDIVTHLCVGYSSAGLFDKAENCLNHMVLYKLTLDLEASKNILKAFFRGSNSKKIRHAIAAMRQLNSLYDQDSLQLVVNNYMRSIEFVKGAVSMETLPQEDLPEVAFIGRSNVGKSSLINAITNRKGLAFTSKTAGKTSEFNYFEVKGSVGAEKEEPRFHLIDLPGVGYARKSKDLRWRWKDLLGVFSRERKTLRCIFHLVDSRHGFLDADHECLDLMESLPSSVEYTIVFTKVDKLRPTDTGALPVSVDIMNAVKKELREKAPNRNIKIVFSSAETKNGAIDVLLAVLNSVA